MYILSVLEIFWERAI